MPLLHAFDTLSPQNTLQDAIIIGHTTTNSAKIWCRSKYSGTHYVLLSLQPVLPNEVTLPHNFPSIGHDLVSSFAFISGVTQVEKVELLDDKDRTECVTFEPLDADTKYYVALVADTSIAARKNWRAGHNKVMSFSTQKSVLSNLSFALFSCHDPFKKGRGSEEIFDEIRNRLDEIGGEFVIAGGDQVYVDSSVKKLDIWRWLIRNKNRFKHYYPNRESELIKEFVYYYRYIYRKYWSGEELLDLFSSYPVYMIWDDHEIMDGWGSYSDDELSDKLDTWLEWENKGLNLFLARAMFKAAKRVYYEYQHSHNPSTNANVWDYSFDRKGVGFYCLDMRGAHQFKKGGTDNLLGKKQMSRFKSWLSKSAADNKALFVVSPVPVLHWSSTVVNVADISTAKDDFRDEWDHESNHTERNILLDAVFEASEKHDIPIVFLSGDVHCAASFKLSRPKSGGRVYQLTSSGVTRKPAPWISRAIVCDKGTLDGETEGVRTRFYCQSFITRNNFSTIKVNLEEGKAVITAEHISLTDDDDELIVKRVQLS